VGGEFLSKYVAERGFGSDVAFAPREGRPDLRRIVVAVHLEVRGKPYLVRTELSGYADQAFRAAAWPHLPGRWRA